MQCYRSVSIRLFLSISISILFVLVVVGPQLFVSAQEYQSSWQACSTFLTPSMDSWAVYAARPFKADELVELTPFFIPLESYHTRHSVLDNYVFSFQRNNNNNNNNGSEEGDSDSANSNNQESLNVVLLGNGAFYNHHQNPNLKYVQVVQKEGDDVPHLVGFRATRDIVAGEQLYVSYGDAIDNSSSLDENNKMDWFERRGLDAQTMTEDYIESNMIPFYLSKHCSKIYGGVGLPTWRDNILPILSSMHYNGAGADTILEPSNWMELDRLAPFDAGLSDARAKVSIKKGEHIEKSLGLVISRNQIRGTPLGPIAFYWENLKIDHHQHLINLRDDEKLILQYQGSDTNWESVDRFIAYSEITVLPVSGNIGLVRRVGGHGEEEYNCKLMIRSNKDYDTNVGVTLELIATRDIAAGDVLKLNIAPSEFEEEYRLLHDEMEESGQPHHPGIFDSIQEEEEL
jgi:hypothetical protein